MNSPSFASSIAIDGLQFAVCLLRGLTLPGGRWSPRLNERGNVIRRPTWGSKWPRIGRLLSASSVKSRWIEMAPHRPCRRPRRPVRCSDFWWRRARLNRVQRLCDASCGMAPTTLARRSVGGPHEATSYRRRPRRGGGAPGRRSGARRVRKPWRARRPLRGGFLHRRWCRSGKHRSTAECGPPRGGGLPGGPRSARLLPLPRVVRRRARAGARAAGIGAGAASSSDSTKRPRKRSPTPRQLVTAGSALRRCTRRGGPSAGAARKACRVARASRYVPPHPRSLTRRTALPALDLARLEIEEGAAATDDPRATAQRKAPR